MESGQPLGAYELLETMKGVGSQKPPTVYRTLDWLTKMGLVRRVASLSKFVARHAGDDCDDVAYLLCRNCGQARVVDIAPFGQVLSETAQSLNFKQEDIVIEVTGLCDRKDCRDPLS